MQEQNHVVPGFYIRSSKTPFFWKFEVMMKSWQNAFEGKLFIFGITAEIILPRPCDQQKQPESLRTDL